MPGCLLALTVTLALCAGCLPRPAPPRPFTSSVLPAPAASVYPSRTGALPTAGTAFIPEPSGTPAGPALPAPTSSLPVASAPPAVAVQGTPPVSPSSLTPAAQHTPAPAAFYVYDLAFVDIGHGWAIGPTGTTGPTGEKPAMRRTSDGGRTWTTSPSPAATGHLHFANVNDGWVYGKGVATTHDGGRTWSEDNLGGEILALQSAGEDVWAVVRICRQTAAPSDERSCPSVLKQWPVTAAPRAAATVPLPAVNGTMVRRGQDRAWMLSTSRAPGEIGTQTLYATADGGRTWVAESPIPTRMDCRHLALDNKGTLWVLCIGGGATIEQERVLFHTTDGGQHWTEVAAGLFPVNSGFPNMTDIGHPQGLTVASPLTVFIPQGRVPPLLATYDGGRTWTSVPEMTVLDEAHSLVRVIFVDALHGWAVTIDGLLFLTHDGGHHWEAASVS